MRLMALYILLFFSQLESKIFDSNSFKELSYLFYNLHQDSLVIFDVDGVLILPSNSAFIPQNYRLYKSKIESLYSHFNVNEKDFLIGLMASNSKPTIIDPVVFSIINLLQSNKVKIIALSAIPSGKIANIENMTKWRFRELESIGINFSNSFDSKKLYTLENLNSHLGGKPSFYKGVLTSNGAFGPTSKGLVLVTFLKKLQFNPKSVVFIDDHLNHLQSVEKHLNDYDPTINFVGIHYLGSLYIEGKHIDQEAVMSEWASLASQVKLQKLS